MNFGVFNLYAKKNPLGYEFERNGDNIEIYQYTLFRLLPNFNIKIEF